MKQTEIAESVSADKARYNEPTLEKQVQLIDVVQAPSTSGVFV